MLTLLLSGGHFFYKFTVSLINIKKKINFELFFLFIFRSANYLVTWLSTVGPVVGLNIPVAYSL